MGSVLTCIQGRWTAFRQERAAKKMRAIDAVIDTEEAAQLKIIRDNSEQLEHCRASLRRMQALCIEQQRRATDEEEQAMIAVGRKRDGHKLQLKNARESLTRCQGLRKMVDDSGRQRMQRESIAFSKVATKLTKLNPDPVAAAREAAKRDLRTAAMITRQKEANAEAQSGLGVSAIQEALEDDEEQQEMDRAMAADDEDRPVTQDSIRAAVAAGVGVQTQLAMMAMPEARVLSPITKAKAGNKYGQLIEAADDDDDGAEEEEKNCNLMRL